MISVGWLIADSLERLMYLVWTPMAILIALSSLVIRPEQGMLLLKWFSPMDHTTLLVLLERLCASGICNWIGSLRAAL